MGEEFKKAIVEVRCSGLSDSDRGLTTACTALSA